MFLLFIWLNQICHCRSIKVKINVRISFSKYFLLTKSLQSRPKHNIWISCFVTEQSYEAILMCFTRRINNSNVKTQPNCKKLKRKVEYLRLLWASMFWYRQHGNLKLDFKISFLWFFTGNCFNMKRFLNKTMTALYVDLVFMFFKYFMVLHGTGFKYSSLI